MQRTITDTIRNVEFEQKDLEIFTIPDVRTRLDTLQQYFFPRLQVLADYGVHLTTKIYDLHPLERMGFVYHPNHRKDAKQNKEFHDVMVGLSGKRDMSRALQTCRKNGEPYRIHQTDLMYRVDENGISVNLPLFHPKVDHKSLTRLATELHDNMYRLTSLLALADLKPTIGPALISPSYALTISNLEDNATWIVSPTYHLPADSTHGLPRIVLAFVVLYPLLEMLIAIGEGEPTRLGQMLIQLQDWYFSEGLDLMAKEMGKVPEPALPAEIPELPSYSFVRPGLWWSTLARDGFKCCCCGRSAKDGIVLHVDHIKPRSLGGTNDTNNLQTLCWKCNIGKSNKSTADLR